MTINPTPIPEPTSLTDIRVVDVAELADEPEPEPGPELETAAWRPGGPVGDFERVAAMDGARILAERDGVTVTGPISSRIRFAKQWMFGLCDDGQREFELSCYDDAGWTIAAAAPKPEPEPEPAADIPDEVVEAALAAIPWASVHQRADMRAALAAADAKRAELEGKA